MKTLLISGSGASAPAPLVELLTRGSTSLEQRRAADLTASDALLDADRVVFWSAGNDAALADVAGRYRRSERAQGREAIVFITAAGGPGGVRLPWARESVESAGWRAAKVMRVAAAESDFMVP
jgi:hypothetical protein